MQIFKRILVGNGKDVMKKSAIWNIIESMEYSVQSAVLLLVITRLGGLYDAGVFTIAYTFTQMIATIGSYGMRSFQVSDIKGEYKFETYLCSRVISIAAMVLVCGVNVLFQDYDRTKIFLMFILCLYRVVDDVDDVIHGEMQKNMRLDIAAKIASIRIFISTTLFIIVYAITRNLIYASMALTVTAIIISVVLNFVAAGEFPSITFKICREKVANLLWTCFPICISGFLYNYLANASKYAIDRNLSEEIQTLFSILFMPIFVINILSSFIFKPMIANMGILWTRGKYDSFVKTVLKQLLIIIGLTVVVMLGGAICGVEMLGWLYGVELIKYKGLFILLLSFGGFAAMGAFFVVVLTIVRKQKCIVMAYGVAVVFNLFFADRVVLRYNIWGAAIVYGVTMGIIVLILAVTLVVTTRRMKGVQNGSFKTDLS